MHRTTAISAGADKRIMNSRPAYDTHQEILHTKTCLGDTADKHGSSKVERIPVCSASEAPSAGCKFMGEKCRPVEK